MKRVVAVLFAIALGLFTTWAVAWLSVLRGWEAGSATYTSRPAFATSPTPTTGFTGGFTSANPTVKWDDRTWSVRTTNGDRTVESPPPFSIPSQYRGRHDPALESCHLSVLAAGWPFSALGSVSVFDFASATGFGATPSPVDLYSLKRPAFTILHFFARHEVLKSGGVELPVQPIWPGLLANTALFAALWLLAFAAFDRVALQPVHGALRSRRGLCPKCAYDLKSDFVAGCPECGWNRTKEAAR